MNLSLHLTIPHLGPSPCQATMALESPLAAKDEVLAGHAAHVFAVAALRYEQLEVVASTLVELLAKHEHTPELVAELLRYSADATWGDARLVREGT